MIETLLDKRVRRGAVEAPFQGPAYTVACVGDSLTEGLMTEDPADHPDARIIPRTTYAEMRRMAEGGARVLHPYCLAPVARAGIPTRLKCTAHPEAPGTLIQ